MLFRSAVMLHGDGPGAITLELGVLGLFGLIVFLLAVKLFRWE